MPTSIRVFRLFEVLHYSEASFIALVSSSLGAESWLVIIRVEREWLMCVCVYTSVATISNMYVDLCIHVDIIPLIHSPKFGIRKVLW